MVVEIIALGGKMRLLAVVLSRCSTLLTHAAATSFAASLLFEDPSLHQKLEGDLPPLGRLLSHTFAPVSASRLAAWQGKVRTCTFPAKCIKTVSAWRLPSKTTLYQWTLMRLKGDVAGKKNQHFPNPMSLRPLNLVSLCPNVQP